MAEIRSFPNNKDEFIGAEEVMKWLHGRTSGVFAAQGRAAVAAVPGAMSVAVSDGDGWLSNDQGDGIVWWISSEKDAGRKLTLPVEMANAVLPRIDRVIVSWQTTNYVALPEVKILKGTPASSPVPPALTNSNLLRQISLAQILIPAGATAVSGDKITDERLDSTVCGIVTDSVAVDTSMMQTKFDIWFEGVKEQLSDNVAGNLQNQINRLKENAVEVATHTKSYTTHTITAPAGAKSLKFKADAAFSDGDTIRLNGVTMSAKTQDGEALSGGAWAAGAVVLCFVEGSTLFFRGGGGADKSQIIVTAPTGSTVTCSNGTITKTASEKNGVWAFKGLDLGTWTVRVTKSGEDPATKVITLTRLEIHYIIVNFRKTPEFTYTGDCEIVDDADNVIPDFASWKGNWKIRFLTSGNLVFTELNQWNGRIDLFAAAGGGGTGKTSSSTLHRGNGGDYNKVTNQAVVVGVAYPIVIGSGGLGAVGAEYGQNGGTTEAFGTTVNGGNGGGANPYSQGVREFLESQYTNRYYCGNYPDATASNGEANTGMGGCNGKKGNAGSFTGGSGIVIVRNAR